MSDKTASFWRTHLASTDSPLIHFVLTKIFDFESIREAAEAIDFALFTVEAKGGKSELDLMDAFAKSMSFPSYFGRNWDALLDLMQDLSWIKAKGYVLLITGGDSLPSLPDGIFSSLVSVLESTVRNWRDERGEFGERTGPVSFNVIFSGGEALKESLLGELREPLCEHLEELSVNIFPAPVRLRKTAIYREAERLVSTGADPEMVLSFLRDHGMDERDSTYSIAGLVGTTVADAKSLIQNSQTWSEVRSRDEQFRKVAQDALRDFGSEDTH
jgi:hypothetical protein